MIYSKQEPEGSRTQRYYVSSDRLHKDATITKFDMYGGGVKWQIKHVGNGRTVNRGTYQECIDYLTFKGW